MPEYATMTTTELAKEYDRMKQRMVEMERRGGEFVPFQKMSPEERATYETIMERLGQLDRWQQRAKGRELLMLQLEGLPGQLKVEKVRAANQDITTFDLSFMIAQSLQKLYSEEDPLTEYHDWVKAQKGIEQAMKADGTSAEELHARDAFVNFLDDRETEMKLVMSLYANTAIHGNGAYKEQAQEKLSFMQFKLSELRRLRTKMREAQVYEQTKKKEEQQFLESVAERTAMQAVEAAAGIGVGTRMSLGERYLLNKAGMAAKGFEDDAAHHIVEFRPVTRTRYEAKERVEIMKRNKDKMRAMLNGMRFGKSKEEQEKEAIEMEKPRVYRMNGFMANRFMSLEGRTA